MDTNINKLIELLNKTDEILEFNFRVYLYQNSNEKIQKQLETIGSLDSIINIIASELTKKCSEQEKIEVVSLYLDILKMISQFVASNLYGSKNINTYIYQINKLIQAAPRLGYRQDQIEELKSDLSIDISKRTKLNQLESEIRSNSISLYNLEKTISEVK
jgi:hypothetical protein